MQGSKGVTVSGFTTPALVFMVSTAQAAPITSTWVGNGGTDFRWGRTGNWDNGRPENGNGKSYTAVIDNGETVQLDKQVEIDVLNLGETTASGLVIEQDRSLGLVSGTSAIGTGSTVQIDALGTLNNQAGSTIENTGDITLNAGSTLANTGGTLTNSGTVNLNDLSTFDNTGGTLNNEDGGEINLDIFLTLGSAAAGTINLKDGSILNNSRWLDITNGTNISAGTVTNDNIMQLYDSSSISGDAAVTNDGIMVLSDSSTISGGTVTNNNSGDIALLASSTISGDAEVTNDGTMSLGDSSTISGDAAVTNDSTMVLSDSSTISGGKVTNNSDGVIRRFGTGTSVIGGTLINQGLVKGDGGGGSFGIGDGLILTGDVSGAGSYEGDITFNGTSENNRSSFRPGNSPALINAETLIFGEYNDLFMEIGGTGRGTEYDAFNISGAVTFGGLLDLSFINSFLPSGPSTFDLFNFGAASGTFANIVLPTLDNMWLWNTDNLYTDGSISIVAAVIDTGVPGPGAVFILVVGLAGFAGLRRKVK